MADAKGQQLPMPMTHTSGQRLHLLLYLHNPRTLESRCNAALTMSCLLLAFHRNTLLESHTVANLWGLRGCHAQPYTSSV